MFDVQQTMSWFDYEIVLHWAHYLQTPNVHLHEVLNNIKTLIAIILITFAILYVVRWDHVDLQIKNYNRA